MYFSWLRRIFKCEKSVKSGRGNTKWKHKVFKIVSLKKNRGKGVIGIVKEECDYCVKTIEGMSYNEFMFFY